MLHATYISCSQYLPYSLLIISTTYLTTTHKQDSLGTSISPNPYPQLIARASISVLNPHRQPIAFSSNIAPSDSIQKPNPKPHKLLSSIPSPKPSNTKKMGCVPSHLSHPSKPHLFPPSYSSSPSSPSSPSKPFFHFRQNPPTTTSYRRGRRQTARRAGYEQLINEGKGGLKSSRLNRVKVDEGGEIWYY